MSFRRIGRLAATVVPVLLWMGCGQVYRPVVIPCSAGGGIPGCPVETAPTPSNFHAVFGITANTLNYPGGAMQIDVSGDTIVGETPNYDPSKPNLGENPTHAAISPNDSRVFVASASSVSGGIDVVSSFTPVFQSRIGSGLGAVATIPVPSLVNQTSSISAISESGNLVTVTLSVPLSNVVAGYAITIAGLVIPNCSPVATPPCNPLAYDGTFPILTINGNTITYTDNAASGLALPSLAGGIASIPPQPVFLNSTQNNVMYVANYNSNSVSAINTTSNVVSNSAIVGAHPVSLAETPNGLKIYVANQGDNTVTSLNTTADLSQNPVTGFSGVNPVWVVARGDSQKIYVLTQGDGQLVTIDEATDTVTSSLPVGGGVVSGVGANFIFYDPILNRLYVTNPVSGTVSVFSDTGGANDTPILLAPPLAIPGLSPTTNPPCAGCSPVIPVSVTALLDGSRFYVASYQTASSCPDPIVGSSLPCVIPELTVFDANTLTLKYPGTPILTLLGAVAANQFAAAPVLSCGPIPLVAGALYSPSTTRFRMFTVAAEDSSHVYVSMCDAGAIADIITNGGNVNNSGGNVPADSLVTDLLTPPAASSGTALQNPIFLLDGQ